MDHVMKEGDVLYRLLLIGDSGAGKTTLFNGFTDQNTGGRTCMNLSGILDGFEKVHVQLLDTSGFTFSKLKHHIEKADGIMLLYDVTNLESFQSVQEMMSVVKEHASSFVKLTVIGNKIDLEDKRVVSTQRGRELVVVAGKEIPDQCMFREITTTNSRNKEVLVSLCKSISDGIANRHQGLVRMHCFTDRERERGKTRS